LTGKTSQKIAPAARFVIYYSNLFAPAPRLRRGKTLKKNRACDALCNLLW